VSAVNASPTERALPPRRIYGDALGTFRHVGTEELIGLADALRYAALDPFDDVDRELSAERLRAAEDELGRRERVRRRHPGRPDPEAVYADRLALAREVREQADIVDVLNAALGCRVEPANRAGTEWRGPCPACGGRARFRIRPGPPGRVWCRRCTWSGDAITLVRNLVPGCEAFGAAVERLADSLGIRGG
jgi:hypothetical protein